MFDIGFWELALIGLIALLVIGPERLPGLARTAGVYLGKARRFMASVKADVERELKADELRRIVEQQARDTGLHEMIDETKNSVGGTGSLLDETRAAIADLEKSASPGGDRQDASHKAADDASGSEQAPVVKAEEPPRT